MEELYFMITKADCPFCEKAKALFERTAGVSLRYVEATDLDHAKILAEKEGVVIPEGYSTVPMIWDCMGGFIEGYSGLLEHASFKAKPVRTVFNSGSLGHVTGKYPLFLGDSLGYSDTINSPYPILELLFQRQQSFHWNEFEVDLTQDRQDMIDAPKGIVALMRKTVLWQSLTDTVAARSITGVLMDLVTNPTLEHLYNIFAYFESIHARTYLHIIKQTFTNPNDALDEGYADMASMERSKVLIDAFDELLNTPHETDPKVVRKSLYRALVAMYMLEALNFKASFAITFGIAEAGYFQGIGQNVSLIARDELLHAQAGKEILKIEMREHPEVFKELEEDIKDIFYTIVGGEKYWTEKLFEEGRHCPGINATRISNYVDFEAAKVAEVLGIPFTGPEVNPLPYMDEWLDSSAVQVAPQELQLSAYLVNSVAAVKDHDALTKRLQKYA